MPFYIIAMHDKLPIRKGNNNPHMPTPIPFGRKKLTFNLLSFMFICLGVVG